MELKLACGIVELHDRQRLNRTFYGIETLLRRNGILLLRVLIVPFMELKLHGDELHERVVES